MNARRFLLVLAVTLFMVALTVTPAAAAKELPKKLHWDVSFWGGKSAFNFAMADFAKDMAEKTNGRWEIQIHYGGVLAPSKEGVDGIKGGLFEITAFDPNYHPAKTPLTTVTQLPFFGPNTMEQRGPWLIAIAKHPAVAKEWAKWNMKLLFPVILPAYNLMSEVPITTVKDFKGLRIRVDETSGKPLEDFGAVITMMPSADIYTALDRGMLDAVSGIWTYFFGAYKIHEKCKYAILGLDQKTVGDYWGVNIDAWNKLPEEWKRIAEQSIAKTTERYIAHVKAADKKWIPIFKKAGVKVSQFPPEERVKIMAKSDASYKAWIKSMKDKGLPGKEVFEYAKAKRDEIMARIK